MSSLGQEHLHPFIVHFPIAIIFIWLILDGLSWFMPKRQSTINLVLLILAAIGAMTSLVANYSGELAQSAHIVKDPAVAPWIAEHAQIALYIFWCYLLLTVMSVMALVANLTWLRSLRLLVSLAVAVLVSIAAYKGSLLVYEKGLGVRIEISKEGKKNSDGRHN